MFSPTVSLASSESRVISVFEHVPETRRYQMEKQRGLQQAPPGRGVPGGKLGLQSHHALPEFFRRLDPARGYHDQLHQESRQHRPRAVRWTNATARHVGFPQPD
jgi:hypothetical protein